MPVVIIVLIILGIGGGSAEAAATDTFDQHLVWSRKFAPLHDPSTTGSIGAGRGPEVWSQRHCPRGARRFDNLPFESWRIDACPGSGGAD